METQFVKPEKATIAVTFLITDLESKKIANFEAYCVLISKLIFCMRHAKKWSSLHIVMQTLNN